MSGSIKIKEPFLFLWYKKEALMWIGALIFLAVSDPAHHHYTLCPISNLGFDFCPGCGLGRSISYFFRLDIVASVMTHPLGIPAVILLIHRSIQVIKQPLIHKIQTV
jgi:hypothetical protein